MKLLFQNKTIEFEQTPSVEEVIEKINELLQEDYYFNYLIADDVEVKEDPEAFLLLNIAQLTILEIIAIPAKEFINELLLSTEEYVKRGVPHLTSLLNEFYNSPTETSWAELGNLFEGMQWVASMIETIDQSVERPANWDKMITHVEPLHEEISNFEKALENTDTVLIADMLQYEVLPVFEAMLEEVQAIIDSEGTRGNLQ